MFDLEPVAGWNSTLKVIILIAVQFVTFCITFSMLFPGALSSKSQLPTDAINKNEGEGPRSKGIDLDGDSIDLVAVYILASNKDQIEIEGKSQQVLSELLSQLSSSKDLDRKIRDKIADTLESDAKSLELYKNQAEKIRQSPKLSYEFLLKSEVPFLYIEPVASYLAANALAGIPSVNSEGFDPVHFEVSSFSIHTYAVMISITHGTSPRNHIICVAPDLDEHVWDTQAIFSEIVDSVGKKFAGSPEENDFFDYNCVILIPETVDTSESIALKNVYLVDNVLQVVKFKTKE